MARLVFIHPEEFSQYLTRFNNTGRMMLLSIGEGTLILRPLVTSKGVDTAEINNLAGDVRAAIWRNFNGARFYLSRIVWREDEAEVRTSGA